MNMQKLLNAHNMNGQKLQELLDTYGEYGLTYDLAKDNGLLTVEWYEDFEEVKKNITEYLTTKSEESEGYLINLERVCIMKIGYLRIGFESYGLISNNSIEDEELDVYFYCYINYTNDNSGWSGVGETDLKFDIDLLESEEVLERAMFDSLIAYAKKHKLSWSTIKYNDRYSSLGMNIYFSNIEDMNGIQEQIIKRASERGLYLDDYFKRLAMNDIRKSAGLEVEDQYKLD